VWRSNLVPRAQEVLNRRREFVDAQKGNAANAHESTRQPALAGSGKINRFASVLTVTSSRMFNLTDRKIPYVPENT